MKTFLPYMLSLFMLQQANGQPSMYIDSAISVNVARVDTANRPKLISLFHFLSAQGFYSRIDLLNYSSAFASAECVDTSFFLMEWYFDNDSKHPRRIYFDNECAPYPDAYVYEITLNDLRSEYKNLKTIQTLSYKKKQIWYTGRYVGQFTTEYCEQKRKELLKRSYQIQIHIARKNNKINISLQIPPKNPKIKIHFETSESPSEE